MEPTRQCQNGLGGVRASSEAEEVGGRHRGPLQAEDQRLGGIHRRPQCDGTAAELGDARDPARPRAWPVELNHRNS